MATEKCGARRRDGEPCRNPAGYKTAHVGIGRCHIHGGNTPTHVRAARVEIERREAARLGIPVEVDPGEAIMAALWSAMGSLIYYQGRVSELEEVTVTEKGPGGASRETAHPLVTLLHQAELQVANISAAALRAGVEERRVRMAERDATAVFGAINAALAACGLGEYADVFRAAFQGELGRSVRAALVK